MSQGNSKTATTPTIGVRLISQGQNSRCYTAELAVTTIAGSEGVHVIKLKNGLYLNYLENTVFELSENNTLQHKTTVYAEEIAGAVKMMMRAVHCTSKGLDLAEKFFTEAHIRVENAYYSTLNDSIKKGISRKDSEVCAQSAAQRAFNGFLVSKVDRPVKVERERTERASYRPKKVRSEKDEIKEKGRGKKDRKGHQKGGKGKKGR